MTDHSRPPAAPHGLISTSPGSYGQSFQAHILEQYKLYVEQTSKISERRTSANTFLLTVNTVLVTLYGLASSSAGSAPHHKEAWQFMVPVAGIILCIAWWQLLRSYRDLNSVKFAVIHELEQHLPAALYAYEWDKAEQGRGDTYLPFANIEPAIPWTFGGLHLALIAVNLK